MTNVIDLKTKKALFNDTIITKLVTDLSPIVGADEAIKVTNAVEQILCTAIVGSARDLASRFASWLFSTLTKAEADTKQL